MPEKNNTVLMTGALSVQPERIKLGRRTSLALTEARVPISQRAEHSTT